jgi:hypothetical protein
MDYNWEEIFKDKSNKDLYDIYIGNSTLPKSTIPLAKRELENRNFDFEDMETNRAAWKLNNLIQEEDFYESQVSMRKLNFIPLKYYLLTVLVLVIVFLFLVPKTHENLFTGFPMLLALVSVFYFSNNYISKKQQEKIDKIKNEKHDLIEKLELDFENEELLDEENPIVKDIKLERNRNFNRIEIMISVTIVLALLLWIVRRMKNFP